MSPTGKIAQPRAVGSTHHHADFQEEGIYRAGGAQQPMIMGCYGIGVNRIVAAIVERATKARQQVAPETLVVAVEKLLDKR